MEYKETNKPSTISWLVPSVLIVAGTAFLYFQNKSLLSQIHPKEVPSLSPGEQQKYMRVEGGADPPILVGDGSIFLRHQGRIFQIAPQDLVMMRLSKAEKLVVEPENGRAMTIMLTPGWSLDSQNSQGFRLSTSDIYPSGEGYVAHCPDPRGWSRKADTYTCGKSKLTPATLNLPNGTCPNSVSHACNIPDNGSSTLSFQ